MRHAILGLLLLLLALPALSDEIVLKDERIIPIVNPHISADSLLADIKVGNSVGQVGYRINTIAKVEFPKPPQLQTATDLLALGQAAQAVPLLDPILSFYGPLKNVPGNWWVPAALLKSTALENLGRDAEAAPLLTDLSRLATDPENALLAKVRLAAVAARRGDYKTALPVYDSALDQSEEAAVLAETWVDKGDSLLASKDYQAALLAYLHVPVFFPDRRLLMPKALLGSARAFKEMKDYKRARESLDDLKSGFAGSSASADADAELKDISALEKIK